MTDGESPSAGLREVVQIDRVIHEPARLLIVAILSAVESADFVYLLRETGLTRGNLSSHLSRLEEAGYVACAKSFRSKLPLTTCRLTPDGESAFAGYRDSLRRALDTIAPRAGEGPPA